MQYYQVSNNIFSSLRCTNLMVTLFYSVTGKNSTKFDLEIFTRVFMGLQNKNKISKMKLIRSTKRNELK